jgi:hypothetical protein
MLGAQTVFCAVPVDAKMLTAAEDEQEIFRIMGLELNRYLQQMTSGLEG